MLEAHVALHAQIADLKQEVAVLRVDAADNLDANGNKHVCVRVCVCMCGFVLDVCIYVCVCVCVCVRVYNICVYVCSCGWTALPNLLPPVC